MADAQQRMIFVLGNICRDKTFELERLPLPGETVNASAMHKGLGGKGLNQAVAAVNAGAAARLVAGIGEDWSDAEAARVQQAAPGLGLAFIAKQGLSDSSTVIVSRSGENVIVTHAGQAEALRMDEAAPHLDFSAGDALLLQGNLGPDITRAAMQEARRKGVRVILNPAPFKPWARDLAGDTDVLILNGQEARGWTGEAKPSAAIEAIEVPLVILTLGAKGCLARRKGEAARRFPAALVEAVDTTAAGDTFCGVFAAEWQATGDAEQAITLAMSAAGLSVTRAGAMASIPSRCEIEQLRREAS
jgi:ribokinase